MKGRRSPLFAFTVLLALVMLLGACAQPAPAPATQAPAAAPTTAPAAAAPTTAPAAPAQAITLKFPSWQQDEAGVADWWKAAIAEFEKTHPGVTIEFTKVPRENYVDTLTTQFAGGAPPDITHLAAFEYPQFADQGWLEPLDELTAKLGVSKDNWTGQSSCAWKGTTYCIMLNYYGGGMVVNQKLFDEAGIKIPTTYDEYLAAAKALTKDTNNDGQIDVYGAAYHTTGGSTEMQNVYSFMLDSGGGWTDKDGNVIVNTPESIKGISRWKEILKSGVTPLNADSGKIRQLMMEGKVATMIDGPWIWGFVQKAAEDVKPNLKIVPMPLDPPMGGESNVISIAKGLSPEKKQLATEFITMITQPEWQTKYAVAISAPAPRQGSVTEEVRKVSPYIDVFTNAMVEAAAKGVSRTPKGMETKVNEMAKAVHDQSQAMIIQDKSPEDVAKDLQAQFEAMKNE